MIPDPSWHFVEVQRRECLFSYRPVKTGLGVEVYRTTVNLISPRVYTYVQSRDVVLRTYFQSCRSREGPPAPVTFFTVSTSQAPHFVHASTKSSCIPHCHWLYCSSLAPRVFLCGTAIFFTDRLDSPCWGPRFGPGFFMIRVTAQTARRTSPRNFRLLRTDHARAPTGWADPRTALWNPHCGVTWNFGSFATN